MKQYLIKSYMRQLIDSLAIRIRAKHVPVLYAPAVYGLAIAAPAFLRGLCLLVIFAIASVPESAFATTRQGVMPEEGKLAIEMDVFDFSMFKRGRMVGKASLTLTLVVLEQSDSEQIRLRMPQIRSDFLNALTVLSRQRFNVNKPINPDIVTAYLTPFLNNRIGKGKANIFVKHALITPT